MQSKPTTHLHLYVALPSAQVHHELKFADKWKLSTISFEAHVAQRMSYYSRKIGTKIKRLSRRLYRHIKKQPAAVDQSAEMEETKSIRTDGKLSAG